MASEKLATGYVELTTKGAKKAERDLDRLNRKFKQTGVAAGSASKLIAGALSGAAVIQGMRYFVQQIEEGQAASAKLNAVLKATGNTTGYTAGELEAYAAQLQQVSRFGDEATATAIAFLATIESLNGNQLKDAIRLSQDLATVLGTDLDSAARMMGRALADPASGLTALQRVGVKFTQAQRDQIKVLADSGKAAEAQALILAELEKRFAGAAEAAGNTLGGKLAQLSNNFGDLWQKIAEGNDGPLLDMIARFNKAVEAIGGLIDAMREYETLQSGNLSDKTDEQLAAEGDIAALQGRIDRLKNQEKETIFGFQTQAAFEASARRKDIEKLLPLAERNSAPQKSERAAERERAAVANAEEARVKQAEERWMEEGRAFDMMAQQAKEMYEANQKVDEERRKALQDEMKLLDDAAMANRDLMEGLRAGSDAHFNQLLDDRMNQRGSRMGLAAFESAIQQSLLTNKDLIPKQQLQELKDANKGLKAMDANLKKMNQFGAGAVA